MGGRNEDSQRTALYSLLRIAGRDSADQRTKKLWICCCASAQLLGESMSSCMFRMRTDLANAEALAIGVLLVLWIRQIDRPE